MSDAPCGHDKRFGGVFFAPKGTGGCVACCFEQAAAERDALKARLAEARTWLDEYRDLLVDEPVGSEGWATKHAIGAWLDDITDSAPREDAP